MCVRLHLICDKLYCKAALSSRTNVCTLGSRSLKTVNYICNARLRKDYIILYMHIEHKQFNNQDIMKEK